MPPRPPPPLRVPISTSSLTRMPNARWFPVQRLLTDATAPCPHTQGPTLLYGTIVEGEICLSLLCTSPLSSSPSPPAAVDLCCDGQQSHGWVPGLGEGWGGVRVDAIQFSRKQTQTNTKNTPSMRCVSRGWPVHKGRVFDPLSPSVLVLLVFWFYLFFEGLLVVQR